MRCADNGSPEDHALAFDPMFRNTGRDSLAQDMLGLAGAIVIGVALALALVA